MIDDTTRDPCAWHGIERLTLLSTPRGVLVERRSDDPTAPDTIPARNVKRPTTYGVRHLIGFSDPTPSTPALLELVRALLVSTNGLTRVELCTRNCDASLVRRLAALLTDAGRVVVVARDADSGTVTVEWMTPAANGYEGGTLWAPDS